MLRDLLDQEGTRVGRKHVATLMAKMGIEALYRKPNLSRRNARHPIYPYLLRGLRVERPNQVWAMDITYIPMARGFVYLAAVFDYIERFHNPRMQRRPDAHDQAFRLLTQPSVETG